MPRKKRFATSIPIPILVLGCLSGCVGGEAQQAVCANRYDEFFSMVGTSASWISLASYGAQPGQDITDALKAALSPMTGLPATAAAGGPTVLYIPPGHYTVHETIQLVAAFGVTIVGDDPATTSIEWTGPEGGVLLQIVDSGVSKLSRLTLDGGGTAEAVVDVVQSACYLASNQNAKCNLPPSSVPGTSVYFLEFNDDVFQHAKNGIVGDFGALPNAVTSERCVVDASGTPICDNPCPKGCSETTTPCPEGCLKWREPAPGTVAAINGNLGNMVIRRSTFDGLSNYGIVLANQNALDWLIADSTFSSSGFAGTEGAPGAAIATVYGASVVAINNLFSANNRDFYLIGGHSNVVRGNVSIGSNAFLWFGGAWGSMVDVSGNYIQTSGQVVANTGINECAAPGVPPYGICVGAYDITFLDNYLSVPGGVGIYTRADPAVTTGGNSFVGASMISPWLGYSPITPLQVDPDNTGASPPVPAAAAFAYSMKFSPNSNLWGIRPVKSTRTVKNVLTDFPACTDPSNTTCASSINAWLGSAPLYSALYFPAYPGGTQGPVGSYYITEPIDLPAGSWVTLLGDGVRSWIVWKGQPGQASDPYMVHFRSAAGLPPSGSIRDLELLAHVQGTSRPGGILIDTYDGANDMVFLDQVWASYAKSLVDLAGLDNTLVRVDQSCAEAERAYGVIGGGAGALGSTRTQGIVAFGGGNVTRSSMAEIKNWGKAVLIGTDNEGRTQGFTLNGSGYLTMNGGRLVTGESPSPYYPTQADVLVQSTFRGKATFMNLDDGASIISTPNPEASVLSLGNMYWPYQTGTCSQPACSFTQQNDVNKQMSLQDYDRCSGPCADEPASPPSGSVAPMLRDVRRTYAAPPYRPCGVANVTVNRVYFQGITSGNPADFARAAVRVQHN